MNKELQFCLPPMFVMRLHSNTINYNFIYTVIVETTQTQKDPLREHGVAKLCKHDNVLKQFDFYQETLVADDEDQVEYKY